MDNYKEHTENVKRVIAGRELDIAVSLKILVPGKDKEHHQSCPFCEGKDRFYVRTGERKTTFHCRQCNFNGDIFALVQRAFQCSFTDALQKVDTGSTNAMHIKPAADYWKNYVSSNPPADDSPVMLDTMPLNEHSPIFKQVQKYRPSITFDDYKRAGARLIGNGIAIPMYGNNGLLSGYVRYLIDGSKKNSAGSKSGIVGADAIYNLNTRRSAKIIFKTAGVSDYLVLSGVIERLGLENDYYCFTNGAGENENPDKFNPLLRPALTGQRVGIIQDNDEAGQKGAERWANAIVGYAKDVRIVRLPNQIFDCTIKDLRDFFGVDGTDFNDLLF